MKSNNNDCIDGFKINIQGKNVNAKITFDEEDNRELNNKPLVTTSHKIDNRIYYIVVIFTILSSIVMFLLIYSKYLRTKDKKMSADLRFSYKNQSYDLMN